MSGPAPIRLPVDYGNPPTERAVCAWLCRINPDEAASQIASRAITADLFVNPPTRDLFKIIEQSCQAGIQTDLPIIEDAIKKGLIDSSVKIEWETSLSENVSAANLSHYVQILKDYRKDREQKRLTARLVEAANAGDLEAVDAYRVKIEALQRSDKPTRDHHFQWAKEFCQQPPEPNYLISVIADLDSTGCIVGDSQAGKSFVAIDRACCVANGRNWLGRKTRQGIVLYIIGEGASGTRKRIKAWHDYHGMEISDRLAIRTVPAALCNPASVKELIESVKEFLADLGEMPVLIELDTLNRNFGPSADESSTKDMTAFVCGMDALRRATGAHVSTVHHFGKGDKNSPRGSIVLPSNVDFSYHVKKTGDPQQPETLLTTMTFEKVKDRQPPAPVAWRWHIQDLPWLDENGDRQTSVVLLQAPAQDPHTTAQDRTRPHTPAKQRIALEALRAALVGHGIDVDEAPGVKSVAEEEWRQAAYSAGISSAEASQNAKRMAFNRARDELVASKKVDCQNDRYWIPHTRTQPHKTAQSAAVCGPDMNAQTAQDRTTPLRGVQVVRVCGIPDPAQPDPATDNEENQNAPTPEPASQTQTLDEVDRALVNAATAKPQTRRDLGRIAGYSKLPDLDQRINKLRLAGLLAMQSGKVIKGTVLLL